MAPKSQKEKKKAAMAAAMAAKQAGEGKTPPPEDVAAAASSDEKASPRTIRKRKPNVPAPAALAVLRSVQSDFQTLRFKHELRVLQTPIVLDPTNGVAAAPKNKVLFAYEEQLLKLLERLDALEHEGVGAVREARKNMIRNVQDRLKVLDRVKKGEKVEVPRELLEEREVFVNGENKTGKNSVMVKKVAAATSNVAWFGRVLLTLLMIALAVFAFLYYVGAQLEEKKKQI
ncbi:hypothetical protein DFJ77DRAFT_452436 [Powellomyces hirtus]|nr:hypothetical protein DFJ77DRAFT_452436 [Powellomyces hirtus]